MRRYYDVFYIEHTWIKLSRAPLCKSMEDNVRIVDVTTENVAETGIYCIKNPKAPGYQKKLQWFKDTINAGLKIKIAVSGDGKELGFVEMIPSELAWRPIEAHNYLFLQCVALFVKEAKNKGIGSQLLSACEEEASCNNRDGLCSVTSNGTWMANKSLFIKNGFEVADKADRFELMVKMLRSNKESPKFCDWSKEQTQYKGWHLVYSDQCPWHEKSIQDITVAASEYGLDLKVRKIKSPEEARKAPSGFGTYALLHDGKLLADHYISRTRFKNILKKELPNQ